MTIDDAKLIAQEIVNRGSPISDDRMVVVDAVEKSYGWIFVFQSEKYLATGDSAYQLAGNGPVVLMRDSNRVHYLGSAKDFEQTVDEFEATLQAEHAT